MIGRELVEVVFSGLTIGVVYYLIALGFTLAYGVGRVMNFSYGSFFTWGGYLAWFFLTNGVGYLPAVLLVVLILFVVFGLGVDRVIVRPLRRRPEFELTITLATVGLAMFLDNLVVVFFGPRTKSLPPLAAGNFEIAGFTFGYELVAMFAVAAVAAVGLGLFLTRTRLGAMIRAVAQDPIGAAIVGIPIDRIFAVTFGISAVLAGLSGILIGHRFFLSPLGGWTILTKALIIVVAGGLGSTRGTLYVAFLLGMMEAVVGWQLGLFWVLPSWFVFLFVMLLFRPSGLFGTTHRSV
jgi:branched-chain amino acid transport system permease protein